MKKLIAVAIVAILLTAAAVVLLTNTKKLIDYSEDDWSDDWPSRPIPASFNFRSVDTDGDGDRCYVTPVKFRNPFGTC